MTTDRPTSIHLYRSNGFWVARDDNPETRRLFGTDTLPTAFTAEAEGPDVYAAICRLNPTARVTVAVYPLTPDLLRAGGAL